MSLEKKMKDLISKQGLSYREKKNTLHTMCPGCQKDDKLSILKKNGSVICYRGKCPFGKQWFVNWLAETARIPLKDAMSMMKEEIVNNDIGRLELNFDSNPEVLQPIKWPPENTVQISELIESDGSTYLSCERGIPPDIAAKYGIRYNTKERRIVFPIFMDGACYGYQGRAIDNVDKNFKMRNNPGFRRELLVMFYDMTPENGDIIIVEGPIDAIKFDKVGGAIPTMGKIISDAQIKRILKKKPKKVFLGLDEDAWEEMEELKNRIFGADLYSIKVPDSCKERCEKIGKKADFGECTFDEAVEAKGKAQKIDRMRLDLHIK